MPGDFQYQWSQLVAKAWADPAFKARLLADPAGVLKEQGLIVPAGITLKVVENTDKVLHLTLPIKPAEKELSEEELQRTAGGAERCRYERCSWERCSYERCSWERCGERCHQ